MRRVVKERHDLYYLDVFAHKSKFAYARELLTSWDVSVADEASLHEQKLAALQGLRMLRNETEWREVVAKRGAHERHKLELRRAMVVALHVSLQGGVWYAIVMAQAYSSRIDQWALDTLDSTLVSSLSSVVVYTILIELMPAACPALAKAAKWDNPKSTRQHMIIGYYAGRVIGLAFLGVSELGMLIDWAEGASGPRWGIGREPSRDLYECGQDQLAVKFLQQGTHVAARTHG